MSESNGGTITPGERMSRLETQLADALRQISIERHRVTNILQIEKVHTEIITTLKSHEARLTEIERREVADEAVTTALTAAKNEARSNKRWVIAVVVVGGGGLLVNMMMLLRVLGEVG